MSAFADYLENALINWLRGTTFPAVPANVYVALFTSATDDASGGTEVSGNAYARVAVSTATGSWAAPSGGNGATSNSNEIAFPTATPAGWGTVTHFAIFDASSGGNRLYHGALAASKTIGAGDVFRFTAGQLQITVA